MSRKESTSYIGQTFGLLTACEPVRANISGQWFWRFQCACGSLVERLACAVRGKHRAGYMPNCGCAPAIKGGSFGKDESGNKFGKLTAVEPTHRRGSNGCVVWLFRCECGRETERDMRIVKECVHDGSIPSCGPCRNLTLSGARP